MSDKTMHNEAAKTKKKKGGRAFRVVVVALMLVIVALLLWLLLGQEKESPMETSIKARLGQLDGKTESEIEAELNRVIEEGMFHVAINAEPSFADGTAEGNLEIENVPNNHYAMRVEIRLQSSGELVYDSGLIYPNYHVQRDSLRLDLDEGVYPATAVFYAYNMENQVGMGQVSSLITIHILS